jgi:predicted permease
MFQLLSADLRFAVRTLRKSPVFALVAVLCIAIGSGSVTTIFSAMNALVLRPLPGATAPRSLVRIERKSPGGSEGISASYALYDRLRARTRTLDGMGVWGKASLTLRVGSEPGFASYGNFVSGNFFALLGVRPLLGRFFVPEEDSTEGTHPVIVLSEGFWRAHLGADRTAIGRTIGVNDHQYTVIGVAPAVFEGLDAPVRTDAWVPMMMQGQLRLRAGPLNSTSVTGLRLFGRLKRGESMETSRRELTALTTEFAREVAEPPSHRKYTEMQFSQLSGLPPDASGPLAVFLALLLGAAGLVLLIASVNVASMLSARAIARRREMAVRAALGARRGRLVRQLLTEILVLFVAGALGGTALATVATAALERLPIPGPLAFSLELSPDWRVLTFALAVSLVTGLIFGIAPSLQAADKDIVTRIRDGSAGSGRRSSLLGNTLVVGQLALSLLLLVGAGLFLRALNRGFRINTGFDASGVATAAFDTESWGYDDQKGRAFYRALREQLTGTSGVTALSFANFLPLTFHGNGGRIQVDGGDGSDPSAGVPVQQLKVDAQYFAAVRMPLVAGRPIARTDDERAPKVVVVNETLARRYWPNESGVGRTIGYQGNRLTVVGVARDAKYTSLTETTPAFIFLPLLQNWEPKQTLLMRTAGEPHTLASDIAAAVRSIDPALPRPVVSSLQEENAIVLIPQRVAAIVTGALGAVGLLLAAVGLYGIVAYSTSRRTREIGIRLALGARSAEVQRMIVREGMRLTIVGLAIGLLSAAAATRLLSRFLFGVSPLDAATFVLMSLTFGAVALLASYLPARSAAKANPMIVLREE